MARYISLGRLTREGAMTIKDAPQRLSRIQGYFQELGVTIIEFYATLGPYDYVVITEGPDDLVTILKSRAFAAMFGSVRWTTLPALPYQDFMKAVMDVPTR